MSITEINDVFDLVHDDLAKVEASLKENLSSTVPFVNHVGSYIINSGGKRFRPIVLILAAKMFNYSGDELFSLATVLEYIHTAALLHDDVIDSAEVRRGDVSVNSLWGNETSVLVGDFLLSRSFSVLIEIGDLRLLKLIADTATELSEGEILEVMKTNDIGITEQDYIQIVTRKTAVLFSAACQSGAILGNVSAQEILALKQFGSNLGIAFQLVDDLLDFVGEGSEFGKSIGKDLQEGKITLPLIFALRVCKKSERAYLSDIITKRSFESSFDYVLDVVKRQGGIDYTEELAREYIQKAKECLSIFPSNSGRDALLAIADFVIQRRF